jgi:hypothetical protein
VQPSRKQEQNQDFGERSRRSYCNRRQRQRRQETKKASRRKPILDIYQQRLSIQEEKRRGQFEWKGARETSQIKRAEDENEGTNTNEGGFFDGASSA